MASRVSAECSPNNSQDCEASTYRQPYDAVLLERNLAAGIEESYSGDALTRLENVGDRFN